MNATLKFLLRIAMTCCLLINLVTLASIPALAETKYSLRGDVDLSFNYGENTDFNRRRHDNDPFLARQRLRVWLTAQPVEPVKIIAMVRIASGEWGKRKFSDGRDTGFQVDTDGVNFRTRFLFIDWQEKDNPWHARAGLIPVNVPHASYYTGILDTSAGGIEVSHQFSDNLKVTALWARPYDEYRNDSEAATRFGGDRGLDDEMDIFMLKLPMKFASGVSLTPWAMYSSIGEDSGYWSSGYGSKTYSGATAAGAAPTTMTSSGDAWWAGFAATIPFSSQLSLKLDAVGASLKTKKEAENYNTEGWQFTGRLDYKLEWATAGLFGWYGSGSDAGDIRDDHTWGVVPVISVFDAGFNPTSFGFGVPGGLNFGGYASNHVGGRWGIGAQLAEMRFFENLTHTLRLAYYRGTHDNDIVKLSAVERFNTQLGGVDYLLMTKKDSALEVNFDHEWKIYEPVFVYANMGYMHLDRQSGWGGKLAGKTDAWQISANLRVNF